MNAAVKTRIIKIGNSRGIRIPKPMLEQSGLGEEVELTVQRGEIVIRSVAHPRAGWAEQLRAATAHGAPPLLDGDVPSLTTFDEEEWEW